MTSPCPILAGYRLVMSRPYACLSSMYVQKSACCSCVCHGWPAQSAVRFLTIFWFPFPLWLALPRDWALLDGGLCFSSAYPFFYYHLLPYHSIIPAAKLFASILLGLFGPTVYSSLMAQYGHWFFYYITSGLLCPICFPFGVSGPFAFLGLPQLFS